MALSDVDREILDFTIELASESLEPGSQATPFGAAVTVGGKLMGFSRSWVVASHDPTAHAEVLAIQRTCKMLGSHQIPGAVLYSSSHPCPLCFMAARWAGIERIVYAGSLLTSAVGGFEDEQYYRELENLKDSQPIEMETPSEGYDNVIADLMAEWKAQWGHKNTLIPEKES